MQLDYFVKKGDKNVCVCREVTVTSHNLQESLFIVSSIAAEKKLKLMI